MKIINFFSVIIFFSFFTSAQTYHFDFSLESKRLPSGDFREMNWGKVFFDTKNNTNMSFLDDGSLKAILWDVPRNMTHVFNVEEDRNNTKFRYSHSNKYAANDSDDNDPYPMDIVKIDSQNFKIDVYIYINQKKTKKKKKVSAIVSLEKSDFEYFVIHADFFSSDHIKKRILEMLPKDSKYYIKKVVVEYVGSQKYILINEIKSTDITLPVPIKKEEK